MVGHWFQSAADFATTWLPLAFFLLVASTALAIAQSGVGSPVMWHTLAVGP